MVGLRSAAFGMIRGGRVSGLRVLFIARLYMLTSSCVVDAGANAPCVYHDLVSNKVNIPLVSKDCETDSLLLYLRHIHLSDCVIYCGVPPHLLLYYRTQLLDEPPIACSLAGYSQSPIEPPQNHHSRTRAPLPHAVQYILTKFQINRDVSAISSMFTPCPPLFFLVSNIHRTHSHELSGL